MDTRGLQQCGPEETNVMALFGSLRLIVGLAFLGVVIAVCLWLLNRLFPETFEDAPDNPASEKFQAQQAGAHNDTETDELSGAIEERKLPKNEERIRR
jgi:hypothetical protein